jgi:hypothetical protein
VRVGLDLPPGLISDDTTFATVGRWEDGSNVRFWRGKPQTIGGWADAIGSNLTGVCRNLLSWTGLSGVVNTAFGTHSALQVFTLGQLYDITPTGFTVGNISATGEVGYGSGTYGSGAYGVTTPGANYALTWSLATYGEYLLANPRGQGLFVWNANVANDATKVDAAPDIITCMLVTPERQVLAFGCNEEVSDTYNPLAIRGSDLEDYTDWTTAPDNNAFEYVLEGGGRIVAARLIGSYVAVWTNNALWLGQFLGNPGQTYRFDKVADDCGAIGPNAVHVTNQTAYWLGPDRQFRFWQLGGAPTIIPCPIRNEFVENVVQTDKIVAAGISQYGETWFHYADGRDGDESSRYLAVNTQGEWFKGRLARSAAIDAGVTETPKMVTPSGQVFNHETGQTANGGEIGWYIKSADQYLGEADRFLQIRGIWPDFESQAGSIKLTVYVRKYPQAQAYTKGPYTLSPGQAKRDFLAQGRVAALKFEGASSPAFMRGGKPSFEVLSTAGQ